LAEQDRERGIGDLVEKLVIFTRLTAKPGRRDDLLASFDALFEAVAHEPGTEVFAMHAARDEPDVACFYEVYRDDDALAAHRESPALHEIVDQLGELVAGSPEVTYVSPRRAKGISF
jgi:quinol monooxygenase YgiN